MAETNHEKTAVTVRPRGTVCEGGEGKIQCLLELPGVRKEDLSIHIENNEMVITGRREKTDGKKFLLRERKVGDFTASYTLDQTVDQSKVDATLEKGILTITLELKEAVKPRTIKVRGE